MGFNFWDERIMMNMNWGLGGDIMACAIDEEC